jgi:hypothetical protein
MDLRDRQAELERLVESRGRGGEVACEIYPTTREFESRRWRHCSTWTRMRPHSGSRCRATRSPGPDAETSGQSNNTNVT